MNSADPSGLSWADQWGAAQPSGRDRREGERVMAYWDAKLRQFGGNPTVAALDLTRIDSAEWTNRFLIAVDPVVERSSLVMYGAGFAKLLALPQQCRTHLPLMRQLPHRYTDIFLKGCAEAQKTSEPVRLEGEVDRYDNGIEQYRVVFIPVGVKPKGLTCFAFGSFSNRLVSA